jgi:hypothetical protein
VVKTVLSVLLISPCEIAVTVTESVSWLFEPGGILTVTVNDLLAEGDKLTDEVDKLVIQFSHDGNKSKVSNTLPMLVIVIV